MTDQNKSPLRRMFAAQSEELLQLERDHLQDRISGGSNALTERAEGLKTTFNTLWTQTVSAEERQGLMTDLLETMGQAARNTSLVPSPPEDAEEKVAFGAVNKLVAGKRLFSALKGLFMQHITEVRITPGMIESMDKTAQQIAHVPVHEKQFYEQTIAMVERDVRVFATELHRHRQAGMN